MMAGTARFLLALGDYQSLSSKGRGMGFWRDVSVVPPASGTTILGVRIADADWGPELDADKRPAILRHQRRTRDRASEGNGIAVHSSAG